jgi:hypothetical protein
MKDNVYKTNEIIINPDSCSMEITSYSPTIWVTQNFACEWFKDAVNEVTAGKNLNNRRREIVFSVLFAESYLLEWVRDSILNNDFIELNNFFPPGSRRGVKEKWKEIPKQLFDKRLLSGLPDLNNKFWSDWNQLVDYRDGLIHASASRPSSSHLSVKEKPIPDGKTLQDMTPGWLIEVTIKMIKEFHKASNLSIPEWMVVDISNA